jgi:hypothetical protein
MGAEKENLNLFLLLPFGFKFIHLGPVRLPDTPLCFRPVDSREPIVEAHAQASTLLEWDALVE